MGSALCYWVLTQTGQVISSTTVQHVTDDDHCNPELTAAITTFDAAIKECLDDTNFIRNDIPGSPPTSRMLIPRPRRTDVASSPLTRNMGTCFMKTLLKMTHQGRNNHLHALLVMDAGGEQIQGRVIQRAKNPDRTKKGTSHKNPLFDTQAYLVDFKDGSVAE